MIRELFHVLPDAVFDILQGIGEQAVRTASFDPLPWSSRRADTFMDAIVDLYGASHVDLTQCASSRSVRIGLRWPCGTRAETRVSEHAMVADPIGAWHAIERAVALAAHTCRPGCLAPSKKPS